MRAISRISVWSNALLLHCFIGERLAAGVLAVPYRLRDTISEANHIVFPFRALNQICFLSCVAADHLPITNMVTKFQAQNLVPFVIT